MLSYDAETRICGRATLEPEQEPPHNKQDWFFSCGTSVWVGPHGKRTFWRFSSSPYVKIWTKSSAWRTDLPRFRWWDHLWAKLSSVPSLHSSRSSWSLTELRCSPSPPLHQIFYTVSIGTASSCSALMCVRPLVPFQVVESSTNIRMGKKIMTLWWAMTEMTVSHSGSLHLLIWSNYRKHLNNAETQRLVKGETSDGAQCKGTDWPLNLMPHVWAGSHLGAALPVTDVFRVCRNWEHSSAEKCFPDVPDRFSQEVDFKATSWPQRMRPSLIFMF